jgi:hypothetical protein
MKVIDQIGLHNLQIFDPMNIKRQNYFEAELVSEYFYLIIMAFMQKHKNYLGVINHQDL